MQKIYKILPLYAFVPIIVCLFTNVITYFGTRIFTMGMYHYDLSIWLDDMIPFTPFMIIFYILAYVSWIVGFIIIGRESRKVCYEVCVAEQIAKLMCMVAFIVIPCTIVRPEITGDGVFEWLTGLIYRMDSPDNLLPSIHCLENWICFRGAMKCKKVGTGYRVIMFISAILVFASTLMVKQHVFLDVVTAIIVVETGLFAAKKFDLGRIYFIIEKKLSGILTKK
ncbi:MAG: hypothetical protein HFG31_09265 [Eubacterium sp.]|nr:hypothetical protein [Eubacterium sp.]